MKIEAGKYYRDKHRRVWGPMRDPRDYWHGKFFSAMNDMDDLLRWDESGSCHDCINQGENARLVCEVKIVDIVITQVKEGEK